jgi:hypothetical protein
MPEDADVDESRGSNHGKKHGKRIKARLPIDTRQIVCTYNTYLREDMFLPGVPPAYYFPCAER